ncbi:MAG: peptidoglycan DD-metalloendopeptidase family protein [Spirochaetes bacterium]|nr:peptidoglycan DD-metalloendopeptidase family protein [Spirochaetota bacterium]
MNARKFRALALIAYALSLSTLSAQDASAFWQRWETASKAGDWENAEAAMREALASYPDQADFGSCLAWSLRQQGRPEEAVAFLEPFFTKQPGEKALREGLAYALLDIGWKRYAIPDYAGAAVHFARAFALLPDDRYVANAYGSVLRDTGRVDECLPILEKAYRAFPDDAYLKPNLAYAYIVKANLLAATGDLAAEGFFAESAALDPVSEAYLDGWGNYLNGRKRHREALAVFEECLRRYPENRWARGNIQFALQEIERALAASGDVAGALREAEAAAARYPRETWFIQDCFDWARRLERFDRAERWLTALATEPGLLDYGKPLAYPKEDLVLHRLGGLVWKYAERQEFKRGFALIDAVGKGFPGALFIEEIRGVLLFHSGKKDDGIAVVNRVYERWINDHPEFAEALVLALPVKGTWIVWGNNRPDSVTHAGMNRFCFDFLGSDDAGSTLMPGRPNPGRNEDYFGFGLDVLASADGIVESVEDGYPDIEPRLTPILGDGNAVVIKDARGFHYNYVHLKKGSAVVKPGQSVTAGQKIAELGNSGYTAVAHLHFGVYSPDWRVSIPVRFTSFFWKDGSGNWVEATNGIPGTGDVIRR